MIAIDTNVVVRIVTRDDPEQVEAATLAKVARRLGERPQIELL